MSSRERPKQDLAAEESDVQNYYVLRVRKRDVHGVAAVALAWIAWSEGGAIFELLSRLFSALGQ